jgi:hypothetical protein
MLHPLVSFNTSINDARSRTLKIQKLCSKTLGKHVSIDRNATLVWLLVTACIEFIDLYGLQICLSGVRGVSGSASAYPHSSENLRV